MFLMSQSICLSTKSYLRVKPGAYPRVEHLKGPGSYLEILDLGKNSTVSDQSNLLSRG
jgi:hypothetical protein